MVSINPPEFTLAENAGNRLTLRSPAGHVAHVFVLEQDIIRVMVLPEGALRSRRSWAVAPGQEDVLSEGRDKFDLSGFSCPAFSLEDTPEGLAVTTGRLRLSIRLRGFYSTWETRVGGTWRGAAADRATQNYNWGFWDSRAYHYLARHADEKYFGLGERAGDANRAEQSYRMTNVDAMGYNARTTDPLYKHIPFYITWRSGTQTPYLLNPAE
jgi:alpha-glucosidase